MTIHKGDGKYRDYKQLEKEFDDKYVLLTRRGENIRLGEWYVEYFSETGDENWQALWDMAGELFPGDGSTRHVYRYKGEPRPYILAS